MLNSIESGGNFYYYYFVWCNESFNIIMQINYIRWEHVPFARSHLSTIFVSVLREPIVSYICLRSLRVDITDVLTANIK